MEAYLMNPGALIAGSLVSVVCTCVRSLALVQFSVSALLRHTRRPWELIAVVEGPGPIKAYLEGVRDVAPIHVEIVEVMASDPSYFAAGLRAAGGDGLVWLDEGTVVTDAWLDQLTSLLASDPKIGAVGPMSNDAEAPQRAEGFEGSNLAMLQQFAGRWRTEHRGQWLISPSLADSCVLVSRRAYEAAGGSEIRSAGELAARVQAIGLSLAVAYDLFVYHVAEGWEGAAESWGRTRSARWTPKGSKPDAARGSNQVRPAPRMREGRGGVSLTMIVRNEEGNLADCLESAAGLFEEIVVADTGSTDRTVEIARRFGAKVVDFPWIDDFAAARNAALAQASCRYAFWLDADDRIDAMNRRRLRELFDGLKDDGAAYVMKQLSVSQDRFATTTSADHVRLFPVRDDVWWTYRVHEQIVPALRAAGIPVRWTEIGIGHVGYVDPALRDSKLDRNLRILLAELRERPGDPFVLFNIGWAAIDRNDPKRALGYLRASLAVSTPRDSIVRKIYVLIARAYQMLGDSASALAACQAGREVEPDDAELLFREGLIRHERGDAAGAEACWRQILSLSRPTTFSSVVTGIYGHLTRRNLARLAEERGDLVEAAGLWKDVIAECPGDAEALGCLSRLSLS